MYVNFLYKIFFSKTYISLIGFVKAALTLYFYPTGLDGNNLSQIITQNITVVLNLTAHARI